MEAVHQGGGRTDGPVAFKDLHDTSPSVYRPDRIQDLEPRDGRIVSSKDLEKKTVQPGSKQGCIAWCHEEPFPTGDFTPPPDPFDGAQPATLVDHVLG